MTAVVPYFQVHQPYRLMRYTFFDIGRSTGYFDDTENERILRRVAEKCYLPMNELLLEQIEATDGRLRFAMAITGTVLSQLEAWCPEALESFQRLAATGSVEIVCETAYHSLAFLSDEAEFVEQVELQRARIRELFDQEPTTFRNTELVISDTVARKASELGFTALLGEGADHLLGFRSSHDVYRCAAAEDVALLLRTYERSDDIAFRFSNRGWEGWPLTAETFAASLADAPEGAAFTGLFMDYETFGEHQWRETGIFDFVADLPAAVLAHDDLEFKTPSEVAAAADLASAEALEIPHEVSWADTERDLTAWLGNHMQQAANRALYELAPAVKRMAAAGHGEVLLDWRRLTTSDHVYYMCTKYFSDGDVHKYFSPYTTPHDAFIAFMNVLSDLKARLRSLEDAASAAVLRPAEDPTKAGSKKKTPPPSRTSGKGRSRPGR